MKRTKGRRRAGSVLAWRRGSGGPLFRHRNILMAENPVHPISQQLGHPGQQRAVPADVHRRTAWVSFVCWVVIFVALYCYLCSSRRRAFLSGISFYTFWHNHSKPPPSPSWLKPFWRQACLFAGWPLGSCVFRACELDSAEMS